MKMPITNLTNLTSATNLYDIFVFNNSVTDGWFVGMIIIAFTIILFISLKKYPTEQALTVTCFISFLISLPLVYINLLNWIFVLVYGLSLAGVMAYSMITGK